MTDGKGYGLSSFIFAVAIGVVLGIFLAVFGLSPLGAKVGYAEAYRDMKAGKIEGHVKKNYPALWIEFNAPEEK
jgi:hypothetical protein